MPDILLELLCEEIPARMQVAAMEHLKKAITTGLVDAGLHYEGAQAFVTPRRLALHVVNVPVATKPQVVERKGPRVGAPDGAIQGFLKAAGLDSIDQAELQDDGKGGQFYIAKQKKEGRPTAEVLQELVRKTVLEFPWPKSMRWGSGALTWVRPLHNICCTFSSETDVEVIEIPLENVTCKAETIGHTFLAPMPFAVKRFDDYVQNLEANYVVLDRERRKDIIRADAQNLAFAQGLEVISDDGLLEEIAGLVEWPVVLMGSFDEAFLSIPERVIQTTIRVNQKCFVLRNASTGALSNKFILVSNLAATDGGAVIIAGNERVIRARLSDAKFFWENDQKIKLEDRVQGLKNVVFHEKLGTQWDRVQRIEAIAANIIADLPNVTWVSDDNEVERIVAETLAKLENAKLTARICKADLLTEMVGEFPELQGYMGRRYAEIEGMPESVCVALEDHYKPRGPGEAVPTDPVAIAVSLADKIDMLTSFWVISEKPTGSKDPYALRRAALGIIRIMWENGVFVSISSLLARSHSKVNSKCRVFLDDGNGNQTAEKQDLMQFFVERLRVYLIELGYKQDHVDAVLSAVPSLDISRIKGRLEVLRTSPSTQFNDILLGFGRANNILKAEEKKNGIGAFEDIPDTQYLLSDNSVLDSVIKFENSLNDSQQNANLDLSRDLQYFRFALDKMAHLSIAIHTYIENTMINDPDPEIRLNRLRLLAYYRRLTRTVADFEKIEG